MNKYIQERNETLKNAERDLQKIVKELRLLLTAQNGFITDEANELAKSQVFQLLQDRLSEVAIGNTIYRY